MKTQTYYHTRLESEANIKDLTVPLQVNCCGVATNNQPFSVDNRIRRDFYYIYFLEGKMTIQDEILYPGDVIALAPELPHSYSSDGHISYIWVHYTGYDAPSVTNSVFCTFGKKAHIGINTEIVDLFKRLFREFIINDRSSNEMCVYILREILTLTNRYMNMAQRNNEPVSAIEYIHKHFKENITIDKLCKMENMCPTAFRIAFRKHTGVSPNEYIISQRINLACRLLTDTDLSIGDVAIETGYSDRYYFSRIFTKKTGTSPLKYRLLNK